jgi:hypothetical protein
MRRSSSSLSLRNRMEITEHHKGGGLGSVVGTVVGGVGGAVLGGPMGAMAGASIGGAVGGMIDGPPKDPMADAYKAQASAGNAQAAAAVQSAGIQANAARDVAQTNLAIAETQAAAGTRAAQMSAMGGIIGAALGANTTTEQIKQWTPVEAGSQTIQSWDLAQRWNKTIQMRTAGYQDVAINHELNGKNWSSLFSDSQWNALKMIDMTKKDMLASASTFGVKGPGNPYGVDMTEQGFMELMSYKKPDEMLKVDPAVAAQRNQQYQAWKQDMMKQGKGLVVDLFENPQLAGSSILTMKGKDPLIDPNMAEFMKTMGTGESTADNAARMNEEIAAIDSKRIKWRSTEGNTPGMGYYFYPDGTMVTDTMQGGRKITAADIYKMNQDKYNTEVKNIQSKYNDKYRSIQEQKGKWDKAIDALTKGEENEYTAQIKELMEAGVIDKYGMINAGALNKYIPPELTTAPAFNAFRDLSPEEQSRYADMYKSLTEVKVDPKLIREETLGSGKVRKTKLNADGTVSAQAIEGYMTDMTGAEHYVSMQGRGMQDWNDRQMMISGNPFRPGMRAATNVNNYMQEVYGVGGQMGPSNKLAQANQGNKGQSKALPAPSSSNTTGTGGNLKTPTSKVVQGSSGPSGGSQSKPAGYEGASLMAGGE